MCPYIEKYGLNTSKLGTTHIGSGMFFEEGCDWWGKNGKPARPPVSQKGKMLLADPAVMERYMNVGTYEKDWKLSLLNNAQYLRLGGLGQEVKPHKHDPS